jgi:TonB family protein
MPMRLRLIAALLLSSCATSTPRARLLVYDVEGHPLSGVQVIATTANAQPVGTVATDAAGYAELQLSPGKWWLHLERNGFHVAEVQATLYPAADTEAMPVVLQRSAPPPQDGFAAVPASPALSAHATAPQPAMGPIWLLSEGKVVKYTPEALVQRVEGVIVVKCKLTKEGMVRGCQVLQGLPFLDQTVVESLESRVYRPVLVGGVPAEIDYTFKIKMSLPR